MAPSILFDDLAFFLAYYGIPPDTELDIFADALPGFVSGIGTSSDILTFVWQYLNILRPGILSVPCFLAPAAIKPTDPHLAAGEKFAAWFYLDKRKCIERIDIACHTHDFVGTTNE